MGVSETTIRRYLGMLEEVYMVCVLQPWHANLMKRQVKAPKIYFKDTGLLHYLLGIRTPLDLETHPKSGASWEGYAIEDLKLDSLLVIYPGSHMYPLAERITDVPLAVLAQAQPQDFFALI